jgi:hypothetical protein
MTRRASPEQRPIFTLKIEGKPGAAGIHALRAVLKILLRRYGFICLSAYEETAPAPITYAQVFTELRHDVARRSGAHSPHHDEKETSS